MSEEISFEHQIAYITARITIEKPDNTTSIGTGFFYNAPLNDGSNRSLTLLISNKHVFENPKFHFTSYLNKRLPDGSPDFGNVITVTQNDFSQSYTEHPNLDVDLACVNASAITATDAFYRNLNENFLKPIDYKKVTPGSDVIFVGYPQNRFDTVNNLPLIRKGTLASLPEVDFNGQGHLVIDAQVFQGSSGSPVFVAWDNHYSLLGVVSATMIKHSKLQIVPSNLNAVGVEQILGLGIVIKQRHVIELIDHTVKSFIKNNP